MKADAVIRLYVTDSGARALFRHESHRTADLQGNEVGRMPVGPVRGRRIQLRAYAEGSDLTLAKDLAVKR
jgi:hypothetical protein